MRREFRFALGYVGTSPSPLTYTESPIFRWGLLGFAIRAADAAYWILVNETKFHSKTSRCTGGIGLGSIGNDEKFFADKRRGGVAAT